jgi:hypothetical protein
MSASFAVGVVGRGAVPLAAGAALALGAGPALVLVHAGRTPAPAPALGGARRLAGRLLDAGLEAAPAGRHAWLACGGPDGAARAARACASAAPAPVLLAVPAARDAEADALLGRCAVVLVAAAPEDPAGALAVATLEAAGIAAALVAPPGAAEAAGLQAGLALTRVRALRAVLAT